MFEEVRNKKGKLLFMWDSDTGAIEIVCEGKKEIVFLRCLQKKYFIKNQNGRPPPDKTAGTDN